MPTESEYWNTVDAIAEEAVEEFPDPERDRDRRMEWVTESVDGSEWIIYENRNQIVLDATDNEPDDDEVNEIAPRGAGWKKLRQLAAFLAMERDINDKVKELDEERAERRAEEPEEWSP